MRVLIALLCLAVTGAAQATSLRTMTTLHSPNVYLRDLFDDAGRNAWGLDPNQAAASSSKRHN
jgi:hypothetical protein